MKKVLFLIVVILLFVGSVTAEAPFTPITQDDLKDLKGEWTGERTAVIGGTRKTDLKIHNDSLPLQGEVILHVPRGAPQTYGFEDGRIEDERLVLICEDTELELHLRLLKGDGKMKLEGDITGAGFSGKVSFKKAQ